MDPWVINNKDACLTVFNKLASDVNQSRKARAEASGYLNRLQDLYFLHMSSFMADILQVFEILQKKLQSNDMLLTDVTKAARLGMHP